MDPLISGAPSHPLSVDRGEMLSELEEGIRSISHGESALFSGGYEWDIGGVTTDKLLSLGIIQQAGVAQPLVDFLQAILAIVNIEELGVREDLLKIHHKAVYWPEPNVYMPLDLRLQGAQQSMEAARQLKSGEAQQKESTQYVQSKFAKSGQYATSVSTRKPLKTYFDEFLKLFAKVFNGQTRLSVGQIESALQDFRQTHRPRDARDVAGCQPPTLATAERQYLKRRPYRLTWARSRPLPIRDALPTPPPPHHPTLH